MKSYNFFLLLLFFALFCLGLYLIKPNITSLFFKAATKKSTKKQKIKTTEPEITIQNFNVKEISKDKKDLWVLNSKEGKIFKKLNQIECIQTTCFLKEADQEIALLKTERSVFDQNRKNLFLYGPVCGNFRELNFTGKNLNYDVANHIVNTKEQLTYWYSNFKLYAQETVFNLKENKIEMKNGIKTEILNYSTSNDS
jgi:LPS export ABC transporter protein LptC